MAVWNLFVNVVGSYIDAMLGPKPSAVIGTIIVLVIIYTITFISCRIDGIREEKRKATKKWWRNINNKNL